MTTCQLFLVPCDGATKSVNLPTCEVFIYAYMRTLQVTSTSENFVPYYSALKGHNEGGVLDADYELYWLPADFLSMITLVMSAGASSISFNFPLANVMISSTAVSE